MKQGALPGLMACPAPHMCDARLFARQARLLVIPCSCSRSPSPCLPLSSACPLHVCPLCYQVPLHVSSACPLCCQVPLPLRLFRMSIMLLGTTSHLFLHNNNQIITIHNNLKLIAFWKLQLGLHLQGSIKSQSDVFASQQQQISDRSGKKPIDLLSHTLFLRPSTVVWHQLFFLAIGCITID